MTVEQFLRSTSRLGESGSRLFYEDRWLVFSGAGDHWVIYQRKSGTQKTRVLFAGDLDAALEILRQGVTRESIIERVAQILSLPNEKAEATLVGLQAAFQVNGKRFSWNKTAAIVLEALFHADSGDPDVLYAAEWMKPASSPENAVTADRLADGPLVNGPN